MIRRSDLDPELVREVARAVERVGGDLDDVRDLLDTWIRVHEVTSRKAGAMRAKVARTPDPFTEAGE